jgi:hypothetical protein
MIKFLKHLATEQITPRHCSIIFLFMFFMLDFKEHWTDWLAYIFAFLLTFFVILSFVKYPDSIKK